MRRQRFTELLSLLATREGYTPAPVDGVRFMRASRPLPRMPVLYDPGIVIVGQGRKRGYLGNQVYTYDAYNYLVLSVPLPFECETEATAAEPLLALCIQVDLASLAELLLTMDGGRTAAPPEAPLSMYSTPLDERLSDASVRLLEAVRNPEEARILGPQIVREIIYRVLCGEQGGALRAAAALHSRFAQVNRALQRMHAEYARELSVEELADVAGMSQSAFHQNFKSITSSSPLQYLKTIRLHKARMLMVHEGLRAGEAAGRVGYQSQSQFSREFKRLFGSTPAGAAEAMRQILAPAVSAAL